MRSSEVVKLRPDYADGYTNIGLTDIEWEKYGSARASLRQGVGAQPEQRAGALLHGADGEARGTSRRGDRRPAKGRRRNIRTRAMRGASWESPTTSKQATRRPWSSSRRCRRSIPTM